MKFLCKWDRDGDGKFIKLIQLHEEKEIKSHQEFGLHEGDILEVTDMKHLGNVEFLSNNL